VSGEEVQLAFLGVSTQAATGSVVGALVQEVVDGSAAEAAGVEVGDVITAVDGRPVADSLDLRLRIISTPPGTDVTLEVFRDGEPVTLTASLGTTG
jgi:S1-C subfamily serine protease